MTLIEVMVTMAAIAIIFAASIPSFGAIFEVKQRAAVRQLGQTYTWLMDEAALRNVTFRVAYNLDLNTWKVEVGDPDTLVFGTPEEREAWEEENGYTNEGLTKEEIDASGYTAVDAWDPNSEDALSSFEGLDDSIFETEQTLPEGIRFDYIYTPQYAPDGIFGQDEPPSDASEQIMAYSYIFPDGTAEHTIVRIVNESGEDGHSLEVDPLQSTVRLTDEIIDPESLLDWIPEEAPLLP